MEKDLWNMYGQKLGEDEVLSFSVSGYDSVNQLF